MAVAEWQWHSGKVTVAKWQWQSGKMAEWQSGSGKSGSGKSVSGNTGWVAKKAQNSHFHSKNTSKTPENGHF
jgi:hypothetical protein